jgi:ATP-dependent Clp protease ATP-binding subunit ClpB
MAVVRSHFKPEFLNRLDDIVVFHALSTDNLVSIVDIQLARLRDRLAERRLHLEVTGAARAWLASHGYDPIYRRVRSGGSCRPRSAIGSPRPC